MKVEIRIPSRSLYSVLCFKVPKLTLRICMDYLIPTMHLSIRFLPTLASEQGNTIGSDHIYIQKIVIERTRYLIYLKFVASDFFQKRISSSAGETPVIQCTPCYFADSVLLMNPLPDRSNYSPLLPHPLRHQINTSLVSLG